MSLMIFFTQYVVHILYQIPNTADLAPNIIETFAAKQAEAQNFSSICFAFFNLICFIIAIPIAKMAEIRGNKSVHAVSLLIMALAYLLMACQPNKVTILGCRCPCWKRLPARGREASAGPCGVRSLPQAKQAERLQCRCGPHPWCPGCRSRSTRPWCTAW